MTCQDLPNIATAPAVSQSAGTMSSKGCGWSQCPLKCIGGHVPRKELTDGFAEAVCNKLGKGVTYLIHNHQRPYELPQPKKAKTTMAATTDLTGEGQE
jgi:hypothetical protein